MVEENNKVLKMPLKFPAKNESEDYLKRVKRMERFLLKLFKLMAQPHP